MAKLSAPLARAAKGRSVAGPGPVVELKRKLPGERGGQLAEPYISHFSFIERGKTNGA